ncbi:MAG: peptidoglycan-binding domain-containing protein [Candidatus Thorarchaeota archaeon]|jgi:peptidoglycan hydrolase-like protein with peptidoglycan-binding domain
MKEDLIKIEKNLKRGDKGRDVKLIQMALRLLGYYNGQITGNFDKDTDWAVRKLQYDTKLRVHKKGGIAIVGPDTIKEINKALNNLPSEIAIYADIKAQKALLDLVDRFYELLKKVKDKLCRDQKKEFEDLKKVMAKLLLKKLEKDLCILEGQLPHAPKSKSSETKKNSKNRYKDLRKIIKSILQETDPGEKNANKRKWILWHFLYIIWHESMHATKRKQLAGGIARGLIQMEPRTLWDLTDKYIYKKKRLVASLAKKVDVSYDEMFKSLKAFRNAGSPINNKWPDRKKRVTRMQSKSKTG